MPINLSSTPPSPELFNKEAEEFAKSFINREQRGEMNKATQIRRFYDEPVSWQERVNGNDAEFKKYEAFIKMLNAKVAYAKGRRLVDDTFEKWFRDCIAATTNAHALNNFRLHFEAVLGFLKALRP